MTALSEAELEGLCERLVASPHIARMSAGPSGTVAAYLPGRRIPGLRLVDGDPIEVHVVMHHDATVGEVESDVAEALGPQFPGATLFIDDVDESVHAGSRRNP